MYLDIYIRDFIGIVSNLAHYLLIVYRKLKRSHRKMTRERLPDGKELKTKKT
jgi:hypothetical protein